MDLSGDTTHPRAGPFPPNPKNRDSHDLSLSPRDVTRDSLVANMLLSLDQFSLAQNQPDHGPFSPGQRGGSTPYDADEHDEQQPSTPRRRPNGRSHGPGNGNANANGNGNSSSSGRAHEHSYSSDAENPDDASRYSSQNSRGHRSNSGSVNFQGQFTRLNSLREPSHSSKSSSSASFDAGYPPNVAAQRHQRRTRRSASFDMSPPHSRGRLQQVPVSSPFRIDFPDTFAPMINDDDDDDYYSAAPNPTVPSGPRREPSNLPMRPPPPPESVDGRKVERRRSTSRSLKSASGRSSKRPTAAPPAVAANEHDSAPAPSVGYGKSKDADPPAPAQAKERPGFFRRVFGGGSAKSGNSNSNSNNASNGTADQRSQARSQPQTKAATAPPSRDTSSSHSHHPPLQKKTSSFFRRRKKSFVDEPMPAQPAPPMPPLDHLNMARDGPAAAATTTAQDSPTSSLRNVMNPYLGDSSGTGLGLAGVATSSPLADITNSSADGGSGQPSGRQEFKREFSPDYEPGPNARIRTVDSGARGERAGGEADDAQAAPQRPQKKPFETRNNSFLDLDGASDNEASSPTQRRHRKTRAHDDPRGTPSPAARSTDADPDATIRAKKPIAPDGGGEREPGRANLGLPMEGARATSFASGSTETDYKTAPSAPPSVRVDGAPDASTTAEPSPKVLGTLKSIDSCKLLDEPEFVVGQPTADDRQKARQIYDGGEAFIQKDKAAAWMGEEGPVRQRTLQAYMELYEFQEHSILAALRSVCGRLVLRAETQQVDRILVAFSKRWCECNPRHGFKATDVIHMICYSIMLLNTDLHLADIEQKMTRSQFIKNTMTTITQAVRESAPDAFVRPSILPEKSALLSEHGRDSPDPDLSSRRRSLRPPPRSESRNGDDPGPLVRAPFHGHRRAWEEQVEFVLKAIYASIRDERLPLFGAEPDKSLGVPQSQSGLSVMGMLKRSPSVLSKAPSETQLSSRGRVADGGARTSASRWTSKSRSRPGLGRTGFSSSRTSFDDGSNSVWSPAMSSATWSRYSLGRTQASMSQDSFGSSMPRGDYQQSIGFANALSHAIFRGDDDGAHGDEATPSLLSADLSSTQLLEDESLELAGPPWVKEGMVMHKHHLDGVGKRAKERNWVEVFAVIQKGQMSLFSLFATTKSQRQKSRSRNNAGKPNGPVGGGNWQDNAVSLGTFNLRLTLASALPSPGYSRTRPHVWALSLPTGAVHLFQVGTPEIIREFVNTANYWSARLSTHPLVGGISNIEYGWSEAIVNNALVSAINESSASLASGSRSSRPGSSTANHNHSHSHHHARKSSAASGSFRGSSFDQVAGPFTNNSGRGKLPGDRIHIAEWAPPTQSIRPSTASEAEQLETLAGYVKSIEKDLQDHNKLRSPMLLAFTPRGHNAGKAMANWERKSAYLLREIVKFRTYVDCLQQADARRREIYTERDLARRAARGELSDGDMEVSDDEAEANETLRP
ncbi:Sec7 domain-containing protein [Purpureocillium lavendulum]|uniref:Sec7 domain-containing protein n=1 Tax=Purpureocillium lavendulum TaxID=1247861 RepID=A0AB34FQS0_9HYPO|nr:Sec7 domain-containing protein [Purpureocillium lavendulum]